ncbi:MAG: MFS transporter [Thermodesulfobacteriota bacterium]
MPRRNKTPFDWWLAGICLSRTCSGMIFMTVAALIPALQREWALSAAQGGSITSGFNLGYAVSLVACSSLADLIGPKKVFLGSMSAAAALTLIFAALARNYQSALILYTLVGFSLGGTYTTGLMLLAHKYPVQKRGLVMGFFIASTSLGYALSLALSGLAGSVGGYRLAFWVTGLGPPTACLVAWITIYRTRITVAARSRQENFHQAVLRNRPAVLLIGGYSFHNWELLGMWAWTPAFLTACLVSSGFGESGALAVASYAAASFHLTGLLASFSVGWLSDRFDRGRVMVVISGLSAACSFIIGWTQGWSIVLTLILGLFYAYTALGDSPVLSAALTEVTPGPYQGAAFGLRSLLGFGAGALSPLIFGLIMDWTAPPGSARLAGHWGWAYGVLGLGGLTAAVMAYLYARTSRKQPEAGSTGKS